jgi:hypothetical protein
VVELPIVVVAWLLQLLQSVSELIKSIFKKADAQTCDGM